MVLADCLGQRFQSGFNIFHPAFAPPMPFGGKVDDKAGVGQLPGFVDKHPDCCAVPVMSEVFSNLYHMTYMVAYMLLLEMPVQHPILNTLRVLLTPNLL